MEILAALASLFVFGIFTLVVLFALIAVSSISAVIIMLFVPVLAVLIIPNTVIAFLSYQHLLLANGMVPINNFHILLFIWSTLIGIILYTEFLTWYRGSMNISASACVNSRSLITPCLGDISFR